MEKKRFNIKKISISFFLEENKNKRHKTKTSKHTRRRLNHYMEEAWGINDSDDDRTL